MWQALAAIAVPLITGVIAFFGSERGFSREKSLERHLELSKAADSTPGAKVALDELIVSEAQALRDRGVALATRRLNSGNLAVAIIFAILTVAVLYVGLLWIASTWGTSIAWLPIVLTVGVGGFLVLFTGVGFTTLYAPPKPKKDEAAE